MDTNRRARRASAGHRKANGHLLFCFIINLIKDRLLDIIDDRTYEDRQELEGVRQDLDDYQYSLDNLEYNIEDSIKYSDYEELQSKLEELENKLEELEVSIES